MYICMGHVSPTVFGVLRQPAPNTIAGLALVNISHNQQLCTKRSVSSYKQGERSDTNGFEEVDFENSFESMSRLGDRLFSTEFTELSM